MRGNEGLIAVAVLGVALAFLGARLWDEEGAFNPVRSAQPARFVDGAGGGRIVLDADRGGHFYLDGEANGAPVRFMVDSGASIVTLTADDARAAGIALRERDYDRPFSTANGTVMSAVTELPELIVEGVRLQDVTVAVSKPGALEVSLFGVNGLNRFARRETTADEMVLVVE